MAGSRRHPLGHVLLQIVRISASGGLLIIILSNVDLTHALPESMGPSTMALIAGGLASTAAALFVSVWRWQIVLETMDKPVRFRPLLSHVFAGQLLSNVLPSTVGGDVLRVQRAAKTTGSAPIAFASVVLDRISGMAALPFIAFVGIALDPEVIWLGKASQISAVAALLTLVGLSAVLFVAGHVRLGGRFAKHTSWMRVIGALHIGIHQIRLHPRNAGRIFLAACLQQVAVIATFAFAARALDMNVKFAVLVAFVPVVSIAQVLPLSVGGLGVREGMLALLLKPLGVPTARSVALGILWYALMVFVSLFGVPALASRRHQREDHAMDSGKVHSRASVS